MVIIIFSVEKNSNAYTTNNSFHIENRKNLQAYLCKPKETLGNEYKISVTAQNSNYPS